MAMTRMTMARMTMARFGDRGEGRNVPRIDNLERVTRLRCAVLEVAEAGPAIRGRFGPL